MIGGTFWRMFNSLFLAQLIVLKRQKTEKANRNKDSTNTSEPNRHPGNTFCG